MPPRKPLPPTIAEQKEDCSLWMPRQMVQRALEGLEDGSIVADKALLIFVKSGEGGSFTTETWRAGLKKDEEIALLSAKWWKSVHDWID